MLLKISKESYLMKRIQIVLPKIILLFFCTIQLNIVCQIGSTIIGVGKVLIAANKFNLLSDNLNKLTTASKIHQSNFILPSSTISKGIPELLLIDTRKYNPILLNNTSTQSTKQSFEQLRLIMENYDMHENKHQQAYEDVLINRKDYTMSNKYENQLNSFSTINMFNESLFSKVSFSDMPKKSVVPSVKMFNPWKEINLFTPLSIDFSGNN
jgi:hypothetical protein